MPPLIGDEEMDAVSSGDESDDKPVYTEMLEDIRGYIQSHTSANRIEAYNKILDRIKQSQVE